MTRRELVLLLPYAGLAAVVIAVMTGFMRSERSRVQQFASTAVAIDGRIVGRNCGNHGQVRYSFTLDGREYSGAESCVSACDEVAVGDPIRVFYAASHPEHSTCRSIARMQADLDGKSDLRLLVALIILAYGAFRITMDEEGRRARTAPPANENTRSS